MRLDRPSSGCTRRTFLTALAVSAASGAVQERGRVFPSDMRRYNDPATEFPVLRVTDPAYTSHLPAYYNRAVTRRGQGLLYSCDRGGSMQAFRIDLRNGQTRELTEAEMLDPASLTLLADERGFAYCDGPLVQMAQLNGGKVRTAYRVPEGWQRGTGFSVAEDSLYATLIEHQEAKHRLRLINLARGTAETVAEAAEPMEDPTPRPKRAGILYRRAGALWIVNYDGQQNRRLKSAPGELGPAMWSPEGRGVLYLNYPEDKTKLHNIRELTPDTNEEKALANTSQFVHFGPNADASVFAGASGSKASPHVLILVRSVKRELTLCEHRASDPRMVAPIFSANSQRIFFLSDQHGKPAIYSMQVERFVTETEAGGEQ